MYSGLTTREMLENGCKGVGSAKITSDDIIWDIRVTTPIAFITASPYQSSIVVAAIARFASDALMGNPSTTRLTENARTSSTSGPSSITWST